MEAMAYTCSPAKQRNKNRGHAIACMGLFSPRFGSTPQFPDFQTSARCLHLPRRGRQAERCKHREDFKTLVGAGQISGFIQLFNNKQSY